ncbi:MAG TPA: DEAD/DEAH box helicase, partial [Desulfobulbaceae bacterium]|nr:DEAD/DEAH box helicase [Desulfobulbaceae bacterium]
MKISLTTEMLPHQHAAVNKLRRSRVGALFMDMGTGKSRIVIELACLRQDKIDKVIWFTLVSLKETVRYEIMKHTTAGNSDIYVFDQKTNDGNLPDTTWYIIGLESLGSSDRVALAANRLITEKSMVVVDESSHIKGYRAKRTKRVTLIAARARYRNILTGTPVSQGIQDLFCQLYFLSPKILGYRSWYGFACNHLEYSKIYRGLITWTYNETWLAAKIKPYVYQITKKECLDLPGKLYKSYFCFLTGQQEEFYEEVKEEFFEDLEFYFDPNSQFECSIPIFRLFTRLQSISCGFYTDEDNQIQSLDNERIILLLDVIQQIPENKKIVIWAKYRYIVKLIDKKLSEVYDRDQVCLFFGDLNEKKRNANINRWRDNGRFLVVTQDSGGYGLDLTAASTVIFYANTFKYSSRIQAEDRCYRIGQEKPVTYIDLWTNCGIENKIRRALKDKKDVANYF